MGIRKVKFNPVFVFRFLSFAGILTLMLTACSSPTPTPQPSEPDAQSQVGDHPPVILRVVEREEIIDGNRWVFQDIFFMDPDGDAAVLAYTVISSSLSYPLDIPDEPIQVSADEQTGEALVTASWVCGMKLTLAVEDRIIDRAGNQSKPVPFNLSCTAPLPIDIGPFLVTGIGMALPVALLLLLAFWLLFRKYPEERLPALRSTILWFLLFMFLKFAHLGLHEGGHALVPLARGLPVTLYAHPFSLSGFSRPGFVSSVLFNLLGSAAALLAALFVSVPLWKHRSPALLPLVMLFPFIALNDGINVMGLMGGMSGDFDHVARLTGFPPALFIALGFIIMGVGLLSLLSLFPLTGLDPRDNSSLFAIPAAMFLWSMLSLIVAYLFVPGSPIDRDYFLGRDILYSANSSILLNAGLGIVLAGLYRTLFRWLYPHLPTWLQANTANLAWKDLCLPGVLWFVSLVIGLIIVI